MYIPVTVRVGALGTHVAMVVNFTQDLRHALSYTTEVQSSSVNSHSYPRGMLPHIPHDR